MSASGCRWGARGYAAKTPAQQSVCIASPLVCCTLAQRLSRAGSSSHTCACAAKASLCAGTTQKRWPQGSSMTHQVWMDACRRAPSCSSRCASASTLSVSMSRCIRLVSCTRCREELQPPGPAGKHHIRARWLISAACRDAHSLLPKAHARFHGLCTTIEQDGAKSAAMHGVSPLCLSLPSPATGLSRRWPVMLYNPTGASL